MSGEVQQFNPQDLAGKLRERIRDSLAGLIPDAQWDSMMKAEVDRFFNRQHGQYQSHPPEFQAIAQRIIAEDVEVRIKNYLATDPGWQSKWGPADKTTGESAPLLPAKLEQMIEANLPQLMRESVIALFTGFAQRSAYATTMEIDRKVMRGA